MKIFTDVLISHNAQTPNGCSNGSISFVQGNVRMAS